MNIRSLLFILLICFCPLAVFAEAVSFEAAINADKTAMGGSLQLTLTVHGTQDVQTPSLPSIEGFEARYIGPATQVKVINGEYSTAKSFTYMLVPLKEGRFTIPSFEIKAAGQTWQSHPLAVEVTSASAAGASGASQSGKTMLDDPQAIADRVRMVLVASRLEPYVDERIALLVKLYVRELPIQNISFPEITQEGFLLSDPVRPRQYQETVDGHPFEVVEFAFHLTPTRSGTLNIGPAVVTGDLLFKNNERRDPFSNSGFNDDFFSGFFNSYSKKPMTITARPLVLQVKDLPAGAPAGFSDGVGHFSFEMVATPAKVKAGDPVTLKMTISGDGDLKMLRFPEFKGSHFKTYDPQIHQDEGQKTLEQVIIPLSRDVKEVPAQTFNYFDPSTGQYASVTKGPFPLEVSPPEKGEEFQAVAFSERPVSLLKESFGKDIVFIKEQPGRFIKRSGWLARNIVVLGVILIFVHCWGIFWGILAYRRRLLADPLLAGRLGAFREAGIALRSLKGMSEKDGNPRDYYAALLKVLTSYLEKKIHLSPGNTDLKTVEQELASRRVDARLLDHVREIYALAERACYASASVGVEEMRRSYFDMEEIITGIEKRVR